MPIEPLVLLPDMFQLVHDGLVATPEVIALGTRIVPISPSKVDTPWVRITRIGGIPPAYQRLDAASLQVDCYVPPANGAEILCHTHARTIRAALFALRGKAFPAGTITGITDTLGLSWHPDPSRNPPTPCWLFGVTVFAHS